MRKNKKSTSSIGNYRIEKFPRNRQLLSEIYDEFLKKHYMVGYCEVQITSGKQLIKQYEQKTGEKISFTGWIAHCVSATVKQFPEINTYRWKHDKIIQFEDIDILVMIEKEVAGKYLPVPFKLRQSQNKDLLTISREIRTAQKKDASEEDQLLDSGKKVRFFALIPKWLRSRIIAKMIHDPFYVKNQGGLIIITAVGMFTNTRLWVGGMGGITTLNIALGGITKRLVKEGNEIIEQEYLQMTMLLDHDLLDGAPAARFQAYLINLIEQGYDLKEPSLNLK